MSLVFRKKTVRKERTPTGKIKAIFGKDLRNVKWVVGTGGVFTHIPSMKTFLKRLFKTTENERLLLPENPKVLIDKYYIFSAMGTISNLYPTGAKKLLLESLGFKDSLF